MSPTSKVTQQDWLNAAFRLIDDGHSPADWTLSVLCQYLGVTKGSFYAHFPGGLRELDLELIAIWGQDNAATALRTSLPAVHAPADRLRMLWAQCARTARRDGAMRRWAAREAAAAAAVSAVDEQLAGFASTAFGDMGFSAAESPVLAAALVNAFAGAYHASPEPPPTDTAAFETLLGVLARAAALQSLAGGGEPVQIAPGAAEGDLVLIAVPRDLPPEALPRLLAQAQDFAARTAAGDHGQPRPGRRTAKRTS